MKNLPLLHFHPNYRRLVLEGFKTSTIRYQNTLQVGKVNIQFGEEEQFFPAEITYLQSKYVENLDDTDARADGFSDHQELISALHFHYPDLPDNPELTIIHFRLQTSD